MVESQKNAVFQNVGSMMKAVKTFNVRNGKIKRAVHGDKKEIIKRQFEKTRELNNILRKTLKEVKINRRQ